MKIRASLENDEETMTGRIRMYVIMRKCFFVFCLVCCPTRCLAGNYLIQEDFDDHNFSSRGWYDTTATSGSISTSTFYQGSGSYECNWHKGSATCSSGDPRRHKFTPSDTVYVSYWLKHSSNWIGSGCSYHPHLIYITTTADGDYIGMARTHLTTYIEENQLRPLIEMQDALNIDETKIGIDLTTTTESRANHGCNGIPDLSGADINGCFSCGTGRHCNERWWISPSVSFTNVPGPNYMGDWHHIEAYFALNSIVNGKAVADGILEYWLDGKLIISENNVMIRSGSNATMKFNNFIIAPYLQCGSGSPIDQYIWIDNLSVAQSKPPGTVLAPSSPTNLQAR